MTVPKTRTNRYRTFTETDFNYLKGRGVILKEMKITHTFKSSSKKQNLWIFHWVHPNRPKAIRPKANRPKTFLRKQFKISSKLYLTLPLTLTGYRQQCLEAFTTPSNIVSLALGIFSFGPMAFGLMTFGLLG